MRIAKTRIQFIPSRSILYGLPGIANRSSLDVAVRLRDLIREICRSMDIDILKGHVSKDHVHLFVSLPPQISVSKLVGRIKGKTSRRLLAENRRLSGQFWGRHLWGRGYFAASSGNVTDDVIMQYIAEQDLEERAQDDDFTLAP